MNRITKCLNNRPRAGIVSSLQCRHYTKSNVTIVGGGIIGTLQALSLAKSPIASSLDITLIEAGDLYKVKPTEHYSNRVSSITPSSASLLQSVGVWDDIKRKNGYSFMKVWDGVGDGVVDFDSSLNMQNLHMGWIVENNHIQHALVESLSSCPNIRVLNGTKVKLQKNEDEEYPIFQLDSGEEIQTQLVVGADGFSSSVRNFAGIESYGWNYNVNGLVATLKVESRADSGTTAFQRFLPTGPIAYLPLSDTYTSIVWTLPVHLAKNVAQMDSHDFVHLVNAAFRLNRVDVAYLLSQIGTEAKISFKDEVDWSVSRASTNKSTPVPPLMVHVEEGSRASFPLRLQNSDSFVSDRIALIGDAAHTVHPLAGQGLNLGFGDVRSLTDSIENAISTGQDIGHHYVLKQYSADRYPKTVGMMAGVDAISKLFSTDNRFVSGIRSFGLNAVNALEPLKSAFVKLAS